MFIGVFPSASYATATVDAGDAARLILYTDGVTEAPRPHTDDLFGLERLVALARAERGRAPDAFVGALLREVRAFAAEPLVDDVTVAVLDLFSP